MNRLLALTAAVALHGGMRAEGASAHDYYWWEHVLAYRNGTTGRTVRYGYWRTTPIVESFVPGPDGYMGVLYSNPDCVGLYRHGRVVSMRQVTVPPQPPETFGTLRVIGFAGKRLVYTVNDSICLLPAGVADRNLRAVPGSAIAVQQWRYGVAVAWEQTERTRIGIASGGRLRPVGTCRGDFIAWLGSTGASAYFATHDWRTRTSFVWRLSGPTARLSLLRRVQRCYWASVIGKPGTAVLSTSLRLDEHLRAQASIVHLLDLRSNTLRALLHFNSELLPVAVEPITREIVGLCRPWSFAPGRIVAVSWVTGRVRTLRDGVYSMAAVTRPAAVARAPTVRAFLPAGRRLSPR